MRFIRKNPYCILCHVRLSTCSDLFEPFIPGGRADCGRKLLAFMGLLRRNNLRPLPKLNQRWRAL